MNTDTLLPVLTSAPQETPMPEDPGRWTQVSDFISIALSAAIIGAAVLILLKLWRQKFPLLGKAAHSGNLRRRREADDRAEWIRRTQWALGAAASTNDRLSSCGAVILEALARSDLTGPENKAILDSVWAGSSTKMRDNEIRHLVAECKVVIQREQDESTLSDSVQRAPDREDVRQDLPRPGESEASRLSLAGNATRADPATREQLFARLRREILAARLKVTLDEQLHRETSPTVKHLAGMKLPPTGRPHRCGGPQGGPAEPGHSSD